MRIHLAVRFKQSIEILSEGCRFRDGGMPPNYEPGRDCDNDTDTAGQTEPAQLVRAGEGQMGSRKEAPAAAPRRPGPCGASP